MIFSISGKKFKQSFIWVCAEESRLLIAKAKIKKKNHCHPLQLDVNLWMSRREYILRCMREGVKLRSGDSNVYVLNCFCTSGSWRSPGKKTEINIFCFKLLLPCPTVKSLVLLFSFEWVQQKNKFDWQLKFELLDVYLHNISSMSTGNFVFLTAGNKRMLCS